MNTLFTMRKSGIIEAIGFNIYGNRISDTNGVAKLNLTSVCIATCDDRFADLAANVASRSIYFAVIFSAVSTSANL